MKNKFLVLFIIILTTISFSKTKIVFWTAPNPNQEAFWKEMVSRYNSQNGDMEIEWSTIPAAGSSEEAILTAVASGRAPDVCTNIFSGFSAQLSEIGALYEMSSLPGF